MSWLIARWAPEALRVEGTVVVEVLAEAANGQRCWARQVELGVPFHSEASARGHLRDLRGEDGFWGATVTTRELLERLPVWRFTGAAEKPVERVAPAVAFALLEERGLA